MEPIRDPEVMRRMELASDLYEFSDQLMRQNLRRRFPEADEAEIEGRLIHWLQKRPGSGVVLPTAPRRSPGRVLTRFHGALAKLAQDLSSLGCRWSIGGGLAAAVRTEPRFLTPEIEAIVAVRDDSDSERVVAALLRRDYRLGADGAQTCADGSRLTLLIPPTEPRGGLVISLMFTSGIEPEVVAESELVELLPGLTVPVARVERLQRGLVLKETS